MKILIGFLFFNCSLEILLEGFIIAILYLTIFVMVKIFSFSRLGWQLKKYLQPDSRVEILPGSGLQVLIVYYPGKMLINRLKILPEHSC